MAKPKEFNLDKQDPASEQEDEETLSAIDEGIRDAEASCTTPIEEVRKRLRNRVSPKS